MRKTKIVATLGPAGDAAGGIAGLIGAGADIVRLNFSHGSQAEHAVRARAARAAAAALGAPLAVLADLQGPKVRVGRLDGGRLDLEAGAEVTIAAAAESGRGRIPCDWPGLPAAVSPGDAILLDDGRLRLEVTATSNDEVRARVIVGGRLLERKSINLPGTTLGLPSLTPKDLDDLRFAVTELAADFVALSFVRSGDDVRELKRRLAELGSPAAVVAKIEKPEAVERIDEVCSALELGDAIMIARGDLGVETDLAKVPAIQKRLLRLADERGLVSITATQMLESMVREASPTRAEASDVFNAIADGSDAVMLSAETAVGRFAIRAVETMDAIAKEAEHWLTDHPGARAQATLIDETFELAICRAAALAARESGAAAIVALTRSGRTALLLSKTDVPVSVPVFALTSEADAFARMSLYYGVRPFLLDREEAGSDLWGAVDRTLVRATGLREDDLVVIASGHRLARGATNVCRLVRIGRPDPD